MYCLGYPNELCNGCMQMKCCIHCFLIWHRNIQYTSLIHCDALRRCRRIFHILTADPPYPPPPLCVALTGMVNICVNVRCYCTVLFSILGDVVVVLRG